jgi:hypothetical protein
MDTASIKNETGSMESGKMYDWMLTLAMMARSSCPYRIHQDGEL